MAALETTPTQTNPDHPIRPAALVCRSDEICRSVGLRFEDGLSDGLSDGRSISHTGLYSTAAQKQSKFKLLYDPLPLTVLIGSGLALVRYKLQSQDKAKLVS
jgi:hypothetical protein